MLESLRSSAIGLLLRIGLVARRHDGSIRWPLHIAPAHLWRHPLVCVRSYGFVYAFKNSPGVIKWLPGRLLPRRWGFGIAGLVEFGDRG